MSPLGTRTITKTRTKTKTVRGSFAWGDFFPGGLLPVGTFGRGDFWLGGFLSGGLMPVPPKFNAYTHRLGFLCVAS